MANDDDKRVQATREGLRHIRRELVKSARDGGIPEEDIEAKLPTVMARHVSIVLLTAALEAGTTEVPKKLQDEVNQILKELALEPVPSVEETEQQTMATTTDDDGDVLVIPVHADDEVCGHRDCAVCKPLNRNGGCDDPDCTGCMEARRADRQNILDERMIGPEPVAADGDDNNDDVDSDIDVDSDSDDDSYEEVETKMEKAKEVKIEDIQVEQIGEKLIVPETITYRQAMQALKRRADEEETALDFEHVFDCGVAEGLHALMTLLERKYGFVVPQRGTKSTFFESVPDFISVELGPNESKLYPWGQLKIPGIEGTLEPGWKLMKKKTAVFKFFGSVKGKHRKKMDEIAQLLKEEVKGKSIYRGQAIRVKFPDLEDTSDLSDFLPRFMAPSTVKRENLILSKVTDKLIDTALFVPIEFSDACRKNGIPLKRGILLEGPYGTGKTLTAAVTQAKCLENGWTFIYLEDVTKFEEAFHFAKQYQPAVIFAEDIDQVLDNPDDGERDEKINSVLNSIDGIDAKNAEVITVLTTNHLVKITQAMLRPGRLDTLVEVRPPDAEAAQRLVRAFAKDKLDPNADLTETGNLLAGQIPAVIREVVERSNLAALRRSNGQSITLIGSDIEETVHGMQAHMKLLIPKETDLRSEAERLADKQAAGRLAAAEVLATAIKTAPPTNGKGATAAAAAVVNPPTS